MDKNPLPSGTRKTGILAIGQSALLLVGIPIAFGLFLTTLFLLPSPADPSPLPSYIWTLMADPVQRISLFFAAGIGLLAYAVWILAISLRHLLPLRKLRRTVEAVIGGDYTAKIWVKGPLEWSVLCDRFSLMVKTFRKKIAVEKYVSKSTAQMVEGLKTGEFSTAPHRQDVTLFFSDIRGFTPYTEAHDPLDVVVTVNRIFDIQVDIIHKYEGDIDKYIGDCIMAVFLNPGQAFKAAVEIQKKLAAFNQAREDKLYVGIGIHTGTAVVGAIGARDALNWTVMGDVVNTAERLCSSCPGGQIYVSDEANSLFKTRQSCRKEKLKLKGRRNESTVAIYRSSPGGAEDED